MVRDDSDKNRPFKVPVFSLDAGKGQGGRPLRLDRHRHRHRRLFSAVAPSGSFWALLLCLVLPRTRILVVDSFLTIHCRPLGPQSRNGRHFQFQPSSKRIIFNEVVTPGFAVSVLHARAADDGYDGLGEYDPSEGLRPQREVVVGDPQLRLKEKERSVTSILKELAAIQQQGPQKYCILGTRHCSYLHQQIIELLAYALVLSGNHVYTSGAGGTHAATIRGALRAEQDDLLTVVLPQSMGKQTKESQELLKEVKDVVSMPQNDDMPLDVASRICNSYLLSQTDQLISFAFHESTTVIEATKEAKELEMLVTTLYLD